MKRFTIILILLFGLQILLSAQDFNSEFYHQFVGERLSLNKLAIDKNDNLYVAGAGRGTIDFDFSENEKKLTIKYGDQFIAKYDDEDLVWVINIEGTKTHEIRDISFDKEGNIFIIGYFYGLIDLDPGVETYELNASNDNHYYIAKYNSNGEFEWAKQFQSKKISIFRIKNYRNNIYLYVGFSGIVDVDPNAGIFELDGGWDYSNAFIKLDSDGDFIDGKLYHLWVSNIVFKGESMILIGSFENAKFSSSDERTAQGYIDGYIARYNLDMELEDVKTLGAGEYETIEFSNLNFLNDTVYVFIMYLKGEVTYGGQLLGKGYYRVIQSLSGEVKTVKKILPSSPKLSNVSYLKSGKVLVSGYFEYEEDFDISENEAILKPRLNWANYYLLLLDKNYDFLNVDYIESTNISGFEMVNDTKNDIYIGCTMNYDGKMLFGSEETIILASEKDLIVQKISTGCNSTESEITLSGCDSLEVNGIIYYESEVVIDTLVNSTGCDSIITINATVNSHKEHSLRVESCESYELNGEVYTESGNYTQILTSNNGCDSILSLDISIIDIITDVGVNGDTLIALFDSNYFYEWIDCGTSQVIANTNHNKFVPSKSGSYAVRISKFGCIEQSDCIDIILSGTQDEKSETNITISPNPTTQKFKILGLPNGTYDVGIYDISGKQVLELKKQNISKNYQIDMSEYKDGVYFLSIKNKDVLVTKKVLKVE